MAFYKLPNRELVSSEDSIKDSTLDSEIPNEILRSSSELLKDNENECTESNYANVFFLPGITGDGREAFYLAEELYKKSNGKRLSYVYYDPEITNYYSPNHSEKIPKNLKEKATQIANNMIEIQKYHPNYPFIIISYSYGCALASQVAEILKHRCGENQDILLVQIDGASPAIMQKYYSKTTDSTIQELIRIINYAAHAAGYKPTFNLTLISIPETEKIDVNKLKKQLSENKCNPIFIKHGEKYFLYGAKNGTWNLSEIANLDSKIVNLFSDKETITIKDIELLPKNFQLILHKHHTQPPLSQITRSQINTLLEKEKEQKKKVSLPEQLNYFSNLLNTENQTSSSKKRFQEYISIAAKNLSYIDNYQFTQPRINKENIPIKVFSTKKTRDKYSNFSSDDNLGWSEYSNNTSQLTEQNQLDSQSHTALLNETNAKELAEKIHHFIEKELTTAYFVENSAQTLKERLKSYLKLNKDPNNKTQYSESLKKTMEELKEILNLVSQQEQNYKTKQTNLITHTAGKNSLFNVQPTNSNNQQTKPTSTKTIQEDVLITNDLNISLNNN